MTDNPNSEDQGMLLVEAVEALKSSWRSGESSIGSIGNQLRGATRISSLLQLVLIDSELAIKFGRECIVEQYISIFPDLLPHRSQIEQHIRELPLRLERSDRELSAGMFSKASLDKTLEHRSKSNSESHLESNVQSKKSTDEKLPEFIGVYRILKELGEGSFGKVLLAQDSRINRYVAIKIQDEEKGEIGLSDAFLHEARAISRLDHPNIVRLLHVDETAEGLGYLVYEYVAGKTLAERVEAANYTVDEAIRWVAAIARALDFAHRRGVVHRDISPRNIMIDNDGNAKLLDFGLSRLDDRFHVADDNRLLGTPHFMPPEQASGKPHWATSYADIFSLGSVLYYVLCGKLPFPGNSVFDICERIQFSAPPSLRSLRDNIPGELEAVVFKAMAKEPQGRYSTGGDFANALEQAVVAGKKSPVDRKPSQVGQYIVQGLALVLLCAGIGVLAFAWQTYQSSLPKAVLTKVKMLVERNAVAKDILDKKTEVLKLKKDDVFSLKWENSEDGLKVVKHNVVLTFGLGEHDRKVFFPSSNFEFLKPNHLYDENTIVIVCLFSRKVPESRLYRLRSPWVTVTDEAKDTLFYTHFATSAAFIENLPKHSKERGGNTPNANDYQTLELDREFKQELIDLGASSYFGVVIHRE